MVQTAEGHYMIVGSTFDSNDGDITFNHGSKDAWLVELDNNGNLVWQKSYGGSLQDEAKAIFLTNDDGYIIAGSTYSNNGDVSGNHSTYATDIWILKLDLHGDIQWQKCLGGSNTDIASDIKQTDDGGYIVLGTVMSDDGDISDNNGGYDYWIIKLDQNGNIEWENAIGGLTNDYSKEILIASDNNYIVVGEAGTGGDVGEVYGGHDIWLARLDFNGNMISENNYGGSGHDEAPSIIEKTPNQFILSSTTRSNDVDVSYNNGEWDIWIINIDNKTALTEYPNEFDFNIYPNPTSDYIIASGLSKSKVQIRNSNGQLIFESLKSNTELSINISSFPNGIYIISFINKDSSSNYKFVKH